VLSQQADMQVQVSPLFGRRVHAVLGDEDERPRKMASTEAIIAEITKL
jgi:hypothetical protein